ncbi:MAG TPA: hypothetical protein VGL42_11530 [Opitutaceae bacterium]|jgi:hypothetical protein
MILGLAAIALAPLFGDGTVLQRGVPLPIWGTAAPHAKVKVSFDGQTAFAFADGQGAWIAYLPALDASAAGQDLAASTTGTPAEETTVQGVAVGEVWIGAGAVDHDVAASFARHLQSRLGVPVAVVSADPAHLDRVLPDAARGIIWFGAPPDAGAIRAWRAHFGLPDLPLFWAGTDPAAAESLRLEHTGEAVTLDRPDKSEIGRRLALIAKSQAYGISADFSGPVFTTAEVEGDSLRLHFRFGDNGLIASGRPLQSFEVAGADGRFYPASASILGDTVLVRSPHVPHPVNVRYAWHDDPSANLFNGAGLPAAPFN